MRRGFGARVGSPWPLPGGKAGPGPPWDNRAMTGSPSSPRPRSPNWCCVSPGHSAWSRRRRRRAPRLRSRPTSPPSSTTPCCGPTPPPPRSIASAPRRAEHRFASACVNPSWVGRVAINLAGSGVVTCSVVGFPLGAHTPAAKAMEAGEAIEHGAGGDRHGHRHRRPPLGDHALVERGIAGVVEVCRAAGALCKVIIEAAMLTDEEKVVASLLAKGAGADFVKTSTGFGPGRHRLRRGADAPAVGPDMGVKAAWGDPHPAGCRGAHRRWCHPPGDVGRGSDRRGAVASAARPRLLDAGTWPGCPGPGRARRRLQRWRGAAELLLQLVDAGLHYPHHRSGVRLPSPRRGCRGLPGGGGGGAGRRHPVPACRPGPVARRPRRPAGTG